MKSVLTLLFVTTALLGCNSSPQAQAQTPSESDIEPESGETLTFSVQDLTITVEHKTMEVSDECPRVTLSDDQGNAIDQQTLCEVNIEGFRRFDAREDFAFISFEDYQVDRDSLVYSIDLALKQGSAFIAECHLPISDGELGAAKCTR